MLFAAHRVSSRIIVSSIRISVQAPAKSFYSHLLRDTRLMVVTGQTIPRGMEVCLSFLRRRNPGFAFSTLLDFGADATGFTMPFLLFED